MSNVVELRKPFAADDIPATLRRIADDIEAGEYGLMTTCVVALGHTGQRPGDDGFVMHGERYELFGCGPRCDMFTVRGLLLTVATHDLDGGDNH